jgi:uncharacterized OB-fold protein
MARVPIQMMGYRCERCGHEWVPRESDQEPKVCPKCKSPYWSVPPKTEQPYEDFRAVVQRTLQGAGKPLTWTEIRSLAGLRQKFPNNRWVHRMEQDIGLVREKAGGGNTMWTLWEDS